MHVQSIMRISFHVTFCSLAFLCNLSSAATSLLDLAITMVGGGDVAKGMDRIIESKSRRPREPRSFNSTLMKTKCEPWAGPNELKLIVEARCGCELRCRAAANALGRGFKLEPQATFRALDYGGWACRVALILSQRSGKTWKFDASAHRALDQLCGLNNRPNPKAARRGLFVVGILHNGLGNMLFQLAFARLLADSLGGHALFTSRIILSEEGPMSTQGLPPHSLEGWSAVQSLFGPATLGSSLPASKSESMWCAPLIPTRSEYIKHNQSAVVKTQFLIADFSFFACASSTNLSECFLHVFSDSSPCRTTG